MSDSLWPHESQHPRPPCPSPSPGVHSDSRPSSRWCHSAISSSVVPFSSCPQSLPASEPFPMSQLFTWGGQNTGVTVLASLLPKNTQDWSPILAPKRQPHEPRKVEMLLHSSTQWLNDKEYSYQWKRHSFDPWVGKIPWRRKWQSRKSHEQRSLVGYSPW